MTEDREQSGAPREPPGETIAEVVAQLREIASQLRTLLDLRVDRVRVGVREAFFRLAGWMLVFAAGCVLLVFATFFLARGASGAIADATGLPWAGDLGGGLLILLALGALGLGAKISLRRRGMARLRRRYGTVDRGGDTDE